MTMSAFPSPHYPAIVPLGSEGCDPFEAFGCAHACDIRRGEDGSLQKYFQYNITKEAAQNLVPAGACVPFLPPNDGSPVGVVHYEDYVRRGTMKKRLGMNIEQQVEQLYASNPDLGFGPVYDVLSNDEWKQIKKLHVPTTKYCQSLLRKNKSIIDAVSSVGVQRSLLQGLLREETHQQIERMYHNELYYGGCLSYEPFKSSTTEGGSGLLFHPSGQALDTLNIHVLESESVPCFKPSTSLKHQISVAGCIRQIETHRLSLKKEIYAGIRTDYHAYVVRCKRKESLKCKLIHDVTSQYRITSISLSPHLEGEFLFTNERGQVSHIDQKKKVSMLPSREHMPAYAHFTAHPCLAFAHTKDQAYQLDFRLPNLTEDQKIPLFQLRSSCLPGDQYFCVARQHPSNPFYHCLATQHYLFLMDERFPHHSVLQWPHLLSTPPTCLHITPSISSPSLTTSDDLLLAASYSSREVHCFQSSSLNGQAPSSTRAPWKIQDSNAWLDLMSVVPSQDEELVRERISRPLVGMCAAKLEQDQQQTITVFQISEVGDIYQQVLKVNNDEEFVESMDQDTLSEPCERKCRDFIERVIMSSESREECDITVKKLKTKKVLKEIARHMVDKSEGCCVCQPGDATRRTGNYACTQCGLTADQSSSLADVFPRAVFTLPRNKADYLSLSKVRSVTKRDAECCKLGKRLWNTWHADEDTTDKTYRKLIKETKKKCPVKRLEKSAKTSIPTPTIAKAPEKTPSRLEQYGIRRRMWQEVQDTMSPRKTPLLVLDRLPMSRADGIRPSRGKKGQSAGVQDVVLPRGELMVDAENLPPPPIPSQLDTPESPRSLSSLDDHSPDIARGSQQQKQKQPNKEQQDLGSDSPDQSPVPNMSLIKLTSRLKKSLKKKKSQTMGF
eukprot:XP_011675280.1 PREDICTED: TATA box-binding protein-associated factor RNA polymerase I subunit C [Strongylocentrotus purpuratus]